LNKNAREASIVRAVLAWLKTIPHAWVIKTLGDSRRAGLPDLIGCINGHAFGIEIKQIGEDATDLQKAVMRKMARAGACVGVAHSKQEAQAILMPLIKAA
jgi:hypothetical protein